MRKISKDVELIELVEICLFFGEDKEKLFRTTGSSDLKKGENDIKSVGIAIIDALLQNFDTKCNISDFDNFRILGFMESQIPIMVK